MGDYHITPVSFRKNVAADNYFKNLKILKVWI